MMATEKPSVLVVDDDVDIATNLCDILQDRGYRIDMAHDGLGALTKLKAERFDLALLDFKMPGMDGAELLAEIRKRYPEVVAIMVTAFASDAGIQRALAAGTLKILSKPIDVAKLLRFLDETIKTEEDT